MNYVFFLSLVIFSINISVENAAPLIQSDAANSTQIDNDYENVNTTELYVIRAIVYEIGILVDEENMTNDSDETHEEVELTFYDPERNGSLIALSNIPFPVQTQVQGHVVTRLAPIDLGTLQIPAESADDPLYQPPETSEAAYPLHNAMLSVATNLSPPITEEI